uniref:Glycosyl hydrolase family 25 n=1 Tax=Meloidogyne hapla TaxID=6305 RepID=A0A1I8B557_MELHA
MEGIDLSELTTFDQFKCLKEFLSAKFVIIRAGRSVGLVDSNLIKNIKNARDAGIDDIDIYIYPCVKPKLNQKKMSTCGDARETITSVLNDLNCNNATFGRVWLDIEGETGKNTENQTYHWYEDEEKNIEFIDEMINTLIENNQLYGIYSSKHYWTKITGNIQKYSSNIPLWYSHYDNLNNFDDYLNSNKYSFGGWKKPFMKQYTDEKSEKQKICNVSVDYNWRPF